MPLALWLARPEWRALPIQVLAVDNAVQPMELGRDVMAAWGDILGQPVWQVRVERGSLEHMPRLEHKLAGTLERQERHLRPWLLTAANVLNELSAESRRMNREDDEDEDGPGGVRRLENLLDELEPLCWPAPLNEDETGTADEALLPAALFVEPGTRLGGKTISRLRDAALERDLIPLAPCTHRGPCPLAHAPAGRGWCHFTFDCEGAPHWLQELSSAAGLAKSALSLAPLLLRAAPAAGEDLFDDRDGFDDADPDSARREAADMLHRPRPVRVLSSPFVVPGLRGQARYACCAAGLAVVPDAAALPPGASLTARAQADMERPGTPRRDRKSGALLLALPAAAGAGGTRRNFPDRREDSRMDQPSGGRSGHDGTFRDRRNGNDRPARRDDRRVAPERPARHQDRRPGRHEDDRSDRRDDPRAFPRNDRRPDGRRPGDRRQGDARGHGRGRGED